MRFKLNNRGRLVIWSGNEIVFRLCPDETEKLWTVLTRHFLKDSVNEPEEELSVDTGETPNGR